MRIELRRGRAPLPTCLSGSPVCAFDTPVTGPVVAVETVWPPRVGLYRRAGPASSRRATGARGPAGSAQPVGAPLVELYGVDGGGGDPELHPMLGPYVLRAGQDETLVRTPSLRARPWTVELAGRGYEMSSPRRGATVVRRRGGPAVLTSRTRRLERAADTVADTVGLGLVLAGPGLVFAPEGGSAPFSAMSLDDAEDAVEEALMCLLGLCSYSRPLLPDAVRRRLPGPVARFTGAYHDGTVALRPSTAEQFWQARGPATAPPLERRAIQPPWTDPPWTAGVS